MPGHDGSTVHVLIAGHPVLTALMPQWHIGHLQRDVPEFLTHLLGASLAPIWGSRIEGFATQEMDEGLRDTSFFLTYQGGGNCVSRMLVEWHQQHFLHALKSPNALGRYFQDRKISTSVAWPNRAQPSIRF